MNELPSGLRARVLASQRTQPAAAPPGAWTRRVVLAVALVVVWALAGALVLSQRDDWATMPVWYRVATVGLVGATGTLLLVLSLSRGRYLTGAPVERVRGALVGLPLLTLLWVVFVAYPSHPPGSFLEELRSSLHCHVFALLASLPLLASLFWLRRGLTLSSPGLIGACLGACAAAWAHLMLFASCPLGGPVHVSFGHVLPTVPLMILGALVGYRAFR